MIWAADDNLVEPEDGCPTCGELHADKLVWQEDEQVRCQSCGTVYRPGEASDHKR